MKIEGAWQSIETAPKDERFVLIAVPHGALESGPVTMGAYLRFEEREDNGRFKKGHWYQADWHGWLGIDGDGRPSWCDPTHWMPLPMPPEGA